MKNEKPLPTYRQRLGKKKKKWKGRVIFLKFNNTLKNIHLLFYNDCVLFSNSRLLSISITFYTNSHPDLLLINNSFQRNCITTWDPNLKGSHNQITTYSKDVISPFIQNLLLHFLWTRGCWWTFLSDIFHS